MAAHFEDNRRCENVLVVSYRPVTDRRVTVMTDARIPR
jgi:hypothetical protein